jgi:hypothetical protein
MEQELIDLIEKYETAKKEYWVSSRSNEEEAWASLQSAMAALTEALKERIRAGKEPVVQHKGRNYQASHTDEHGELLAWKEKETVSRIVEL